MTGGRVNVWKYSKSQRDVVLLNGMRNMMVLERAALSRVYASWD